MSYKEVQQEWNDRRREYEQLSAAEVPGFHARTIIDDTIGKLYALRARLKTDLPAELPALLDDVEARVEALIDLAYDQDVDPVTEDTTLESPEHLRGWSRHLSPTASQCLSYCSCGGLFLDDSVASRDSQETK